MLKRVAAAVQGYAKANQTANAQDTLRWGCDYLLKLFKQIDGTNETKPDYAIIYQVCFSPQQTVSLAEGFSLEVWKRRRRRRLSAGHGKASHQSV